MGSPHDNLPALEGDVWILTVELTEPVELEDGQQQELTFTTIQPSKEEAYKRLVYVAQTQWQAEIDTVLEAKALGGNRDEQLEELFERAEAGEVRAPPLIRQEFIDYLTSMPVPLAQEMLATIPMPVRDRIEPDLPPHLREQ